MKDENKTKEQLLAELKELRQQNQILTAKTDTSALLASYEGRLHFQSSLLKFLEQAVIATDLQGTITYLNPFAEKLYQWSQKEALGKNILEVVVPQMTKEQAESIMETVVKRESWHGEFLCQKKDGTLFPAFVSDSPIHDKEGNLAGIVGISRDITERKRIEEELRQYQHIVSSSTDMMALLDRDFVYRAANKAYRGALNVNSDEIIGKTPFEIFGEDFFKEVIKPNAMRCLSGETIHYQQWFDFPNHGKRYMDIQYYPYLGADKTVKGFVVNGRDITEKNKLEQQLKHSQKMETIGTLAGGIAHEFNNLLTPILGYAEVLKRNKYENDPDTAKLNNILTAGKRARNLVWQMLAYGRQSMSKKAPLKLETLVEQTIDLIQNTTPPNIAIKKEIEADLPPVFGMPDEIQQVILNLCINASHAMPEGGTLTTSITPAGQQTFINAEGKERKNNFIKLTVQDTGVGMDQETLERMYDPFFTTKEVGKGSGLGLSVVHGIVEQHEGHIVVSSVIEQGTEFHVYLPASQESIELPAEKPKPLLKGYGRILIVDDEPSLIGVAGEMLKYVGYDVTGMLNPQDALNAFTQAPENFDLLIIDYGLPKMNGKQLASELKKIRPDIPIILFTGYGDLIAKENIRSWGIDELLMKPFDLDELSEIIQRILRKD
ncbi:MAG: PAS domain S-box protein [SAR324 cluster bacterium]|nr:PAS domain S-box protein [SAR324 cluster bacterium]